MTIALAALAAAGAMTLGLTATFVHPQVELAKVTASDAASGDIFGHLVSISGDTAVVGANRDDNARGAAYVYVRNGTAWPQQAKLTAFDAAPVDDFGQVSISGDTIVVGAFGDDDTFSASGSAYVFVRSGTTWTLQAKLHAGDAAFNDQFGLTTAISGDTAVVTAPFKDGVGTDSGAAYVFVRKGTGTWTQQAKLTASDAAPGDRFGFFVSNSGDTGIIGAFFDDDAGSNSGSAYLFEVGPADPIHLVNDLIADVIVLNLNTGIQNSLDSKLKAVLNALEDINNNNDQAAIKVLQAFINSVQAQSGKKISVADADALIAAAQAIIDLLC
ncbi:MAG: FG-GAP repeat protein [Armatimonadetes bacterium]|nr:FG-GAP repeat protein [Armatimonadota bacterium]